MQLVLSIKNCHVSIIKFINQFSVNIYIVKSYTYMTFRRVECQSSKWVLEETKKSFLILN
jgi:hypothetical protein